jgi:hypothetical protein
LPPQDNPHSHATTGTTAHVMPARIAAKIAAGGRKPRLSITRHEIQHCLQAEQ